MLVATAILMESALSFLGLSDPERRELGQHDRAGARAAAHRVVSQRRAGVAIVLTVLALNFLGDALNDALNPRVAAER